MNLAKSLLALIVIVVATTAGRAAERGEPECLSLAGAWGFALDENGKGIEKKWFAAPLPETITLPGTTDEAHKGKLNTQTKETERLSRLYSFTGAAGTSARSRFPNAGRTDTSRSSWNAPK